MLVGSAKSCTAVVTDTDGGPVSAPSGTVSFASSHSGAFAPGAACTGGDAGHAASQGSTPVAATAPAITVTTEAASGVTVTSAVLHAVIGTGGTATSWQFQYGKRTSYGTGTPVQSIPAGKAAVSVSLTVKRLSPLRYHFRLVGITGSGAALKRRQWSRASCSC